MTEGFGDALNDPRAGSRKGDPVSGYVQAPANCNCEVCGAACDCNTCACDDCACDRCAHPDQVADPVG